MMWYIRWLLSLLELARFEIVAGIIANVWVVIILAVRLEPAGEVNPHLLSMGLAWSLLLGGMLAGGLAGCAIALNDVLDVRYDRMFGLHRPIPEGRIAQTSATVAAMLGLLLAVGASTAFGGQSVLFTVAAAVGVLFYNLTGRFIPSVGILVLGVLYALTMMIPNPDMLFAWPVVLVLTHTICLATIQHWLTGKRPSIGVIDGWLIVGGWIFLMLLLLVIQQARGHSIAFEPSEQWEHWESLLRWAWVGPLLVVMALTFFVMRALWFVQSYDRRKLSSELHTWSSRAMVGYAVAWCFGMGLWWEWLLPASLGLLAWCVTLVRQCVQLQSMRYSLDITDSTRH